jgi:hypothetical protein
MTQFTIVNVVPQSHSNETWQDSEPSIGVNQADPTHIVLSAFTPADPGQTNGPVYYSEDGGASWNLSFIVPGGEPNDQTFKFGGRSSQFYGGDLFDSGLTLNALSTSDPFVPGTMSTLETSGDNDQPFIESTTVPYGPDAGKDRVYIGLNDLSVFGTTGQTAAIDVCLDATAATPVFTRVYIDHRSTGDASQDGPQVRTAVHLDGSVYAVFAGWRSSAITTDVVVVRDDNWAVGPNPFTALVDPNDSVAGFRVQTAVPITFNFNVSQQRTAGSFAIAVDPRDSDIVMICWADLNAGVYRLHLQRSTNRGASWSGVLLSVDNATNPALAISTIGKIGFLYQKFVSGTDKWETHFQESTNATTWSDTIICTTPAATPVLNTAQGLTYIGDYLDLVAVGKNFFGTFCANNTPDPANFPATPATATRPNGAIFLRNVTTAAPWNLLGTDGVTQVNVSIDPFFVSAVEVAASSDFYVRDWTDSASSADNGAEPSLRSNFWSTSDVWNQFSSNVAFPPNASDQPQSENAQAGADNYGFARIRRNVLPPSGSGSTTVSAHFLVSEFGTGSNFVDWIFSDPSDPDVTFPTLADVSVNFAETDLGPLVTPPFTWNLAATTSDHLCLAVEIYAPGDPFAAPGLTGSAPGTTAATFSVVNDNNKAQRNLQVNMAAANHLGAHYYGIVHNAGLLTRDIVIGLAQPAGLRTLPEGTTIEIVTEKGIVAQRPWRAWDQITLAGMTPGENRWIGVRLPVPAGAAAQTVNFAELKNGRPVNGFGIAAQPAPLNDVIGAVLSFHHKVLVRLEKGFQLPAAGSALTGSGAGEEEGEERKRHGLDVEEHVRIRERDLRIEIDLRIRRGAGRGEEEPPAPPATPDPAHYERFVRRAAASLTACLAELGRGDPFEIATAIGAISAAASGDVGALVTAHASVLHKFDAFLTMLQKAEGDRADILQMVRWHHALCGRARLAGLPETHGVKQRLAAFEGRAIARTLQLAEYGTLLAQLAPALRQSAAGLGAAATLDPLITAMEAAGMARAQQKAHRDFLLALESVA